MSVSAEESDAASSSSSNYVVGQKRKYEEATSVEPGGSFALKMMAKMGYKEGKGLGKNEQGRTEIVKESTHKVRLFCASYVSLFAT